MLSVILSLHASAQPGGSKPNIVVIMLDDARYDMFKANGGPAFFNTPAVDRLTDEGANFAFTGATTSLCAPSRASIYTGLYAHHHGTVDNGTSPKEGLPYISTILQQNGYKTAFIGKWLLDFHLPDDPIGFDYWAVTDSIEHINLTMRFNDGSIAYYPEHEAVVYTNLGLNFVENMVPDDAPWALFLFYRFPHSPYEPMPGEETLYQQSLIEFPDNNKPYTKNFPSYLYPGHLFEGDSTELDQVIRDYYENGKAADYSVDTVLKYLEQHEILDSTLIIFSSDNGYLLGEHGMEKKVLAYEESLRLPLFVRYPAWFAPGTVVDNEIAANIDIATTLLDAAGIPDTFNMDGVSLHQLAQGQIHRKYFYYENYLASGHKWLSVRSLDYSYIYSFCTTLTEEFYDLNADPKQNINLIYDPEYAALIQSFRLKRDSLRLATGDTLPIELAKCKLESAFFADTDGDQYGNPDIRKDSIVQPIGYVTDTTDCNDNNASVNPGAPELCNGLDDNCNSVIDEGLYLTYFADSDGDGYGSVSDPGISLCTDPGNGFSMDHSDCNDSDAEINPSVPEVCNGLDDNCNTSEDEGLDFFTYFIDTDQDLYGDASSTGSYLCYNPGTGYATNNFDCQDGNNTINPAATEVCNSQDDDCSGTADDGLAFTTYFADLDNDSYGDANDIGTSLCNDPGLGSSDNNFDCNDSNSDINPSAEEVCNDLDDDCSGNSDDGLNFTIYYTDVDGDHYGDLNDVGLDLCDNPGMGFSVNNLDCNDTNADINPSATETCNSLDDNCSGLADDGLIFTTYYADIDNDSYGDLSDSGISLCIEPGPGFSTNNLDCNDTTSAIQPLAAEICNGLDDNCNNSIDDGLVFTTYFVDQDGDTYGTQTDDAISLCNDPGPGFSTDNTDCNDTLQSINPGAAEGCNGVDDNCNGTADDGLTFITYYTDLDNDSFGDLTDVGSSLCNDPGFGFSTNNSDCNDGIAAINPSAFESCNGLDDNCNGTADDGLTFITYFTDLDNDSFGDLSDAGSSLCNDPGIGFVTNNTDCNDGSAAINPSAFESCNGLDDNCNGTADDGLTFITYYTDLDNDSFGDLSDLGSSLCNNPGFGFSTSNIDCNDGSAAINPSAFESCNGVDDNCNGTADDGLTFITYYADLDNDSFGDLTDVGSSLCNDPGFGFATNNTDCDDGSAAINPSAFESCNGLDDNCNGTADDGLTFITYYTDLDNDSFGDLADAGSSLCNDPGFGFATNNTDCNDGSASINPSALESCNGLDDNCNGTADDGLIFITYYTDLDNDSYGDLTDVGSSLCNDPGFGFATNNTDCDDGSAAINPSAFESCNGIDDNCNGTADDGLTFITYYTDLDNDSFGDLTDVGSSLCSDPGFGFATNNTDCNDGIAAINPSAFESCNGLDDNCNGTADDGLTFITYYADLDNDSFGDLTDLGSSLCNDPGIGFVTNNTDCNDGSAAINPSAFESCNGLDDNCNGTTDDGLIFITYYIDQDDDNFGDLTDNGISLCSNPGAGFVTNHSDCNDANSAINPAAFEICNGLDENCNGTADDGLIFITYYNDQDDDNYGDLTDNGISLCNSPGTGFVTNHTDCNDANSAINPAAFEICNGIDENCNGSTDEGLIFTIFYNDADNDSYGDLNSNGSSFCSNPGTGYSANQSDCNDDDPSISPVAFESCNEIDDNCNTIIDEGITYITYFPDQDHDGYGNSFSVGIELCTDPGDGYADNNIDCYDISASVNPGMPELCNSIDDNCNGTADEGLAFITYYTDLDNDSFGDLTDAGSSLCNDPGLGFSITNSDCNDSSPLIHPDALESCNGMDDNCNGTADDGLTFITYYTDLDNDSFGDQLASGNSLCNDPGIGFATNNTDCNDANAAINPSAFESCNGLDDNCNGSNDDGLTFITYYADLDIDSYGDQLAPGNSLCNDPGFGFSTSNSDCNDNSPLINPAALESCNGVDDNCNGTADDGLSFITYYADLDNDSFGDLADLGSSLCNDPGLGFSSTNSDCNDNSTLINPGALESCNGVDDNCNGTADDGIIFETYYSDLDFDNFGDESDAGDAYCNNPGPGYSINNLDCNDDINGINPGASESCNSIDDDCNGSTDESVAVITYYFDSDTDGFGNAGLQVDSCQQPAGYVVNSLDCNDDNSAVYPGAEEICNSFDDNCNGNTDEGLFIVYYTDADGDNFGDINSTGISLCMDPGDGFSVNSNDCDDNNPLINPTAFESCNGMDDNCNGTGDDGLPFFTYYADLDNDGYGDQLAAGNSLCNDPGFGFSVSNSDCNDSNPQVNPAASESCNGVDDNCNGTADDGLAFITYYTDLDIDSFGDLSDLGSSLCNDPGFGFATNNTDCNDGSAATNPSAFESCNGVDDNCNGTADDGLTFITYYADLDHDSFGNIADPGSSLCNDPGLGYAVSNTDCNDGNDLINPAISESCNQIDDNCNGSVDDGLTYTTYFIDQDHDGFGDFFIAGTQMCSNPGDGFADNNGDCYDLSASVNPDAPESCNGIDDNCNSVADDGLVFSIYYADLDGDSYGDISDTGNSYCTDPGLGFAVNNMDCNDLNPTINPSGNEICNGLDDNCNGSADDGLTFSNYYSDLDNDNYGDMSGTAVSYCANPGLGFSSDNSDCNDNSPLINPAAFESCNGVDDNCNGTADDGLTFITYYTDLDNDSYGDQLASGNSLCNDPGFGFSTSNSDCNDNSPLINPAALESCNGLDDNCNGTADDGLTFITYYTDLDNDSYGDQLASGNSLCNDPGIGFSTNNSDCNDNSPLINPAAFESCNGIDDNCNGTADDGLTFITYYTDLDNDSFGDLTDVGSSLCNDPGIGFVTNNTDCNDGSAAINPSAFESCNGVDDNCNGTADDGLAFITYYTDLDNDSYGDQLASGNSLCNDPGIGFSTNNSDCNDNSPLINPAAFESCNGVDDNCNGTADDGLTFITYYTDLDNDSFGDLTDVGSSLCNDPGIGFATNNTDCNDGIAAINPSAFESCNGLDDNCNGTADDGLTFITYYADLDNDSYGDQLSSGNSLCSDPGIGFATNNTDCNDNSPLINPAALESCNGIDDNCNGTADDGLTFITYYADLDNDSFGDLADTGSSLCNDPGIGFVTNNTDCNDGSAAINPSAFESCNGLDDNCNGTADDGLTFITYYTDLDNDSFGDLTDAGSSLCNDPGIGFVTNNTDCNDGSAAINPSAFESCNGLDDNCNGTADDGLTFITYYTDLDNDGFGDLTDVGNSLCNDPGIGFAINNVDCNDGSAAINPSAFESCNGVDDNCNGTADDGLTFITYYTDLDNDSFGDLTDAGSSLCNDPGIGFATNNTDCNDGSAAINPSAFESCNGLDDNCNGTADDGLTFITYYTDLDNDGFGDLTDVGNSLCNDPGIGFVTNNTDCNDGSAAINPSALESCNGVDDNCNGTADDGLTFITYYTDLDNDSFGDLSDLGSSLCNDPGFGFSTNNTDCNDGSAAINPSAFESCNGLDDNCNGTADDGLTFITYYTDLDNDSFGDLSDLGSSLCNDPGIGFVTNNTDCNDGSAAINPSALESCNGVDDNCNGTADDGLTFITYYTDLDNDSYGDQLASGNSLCNDPGFGFSTSNTDCNDNSPLINPAAFESCNGIDDNCNGTADDGLTFITYYTDLDNDSFGDLTDAGSSLCNDPGFGFATNNTDCNDGSAAINPSALESCNGVDDNCNGTADDGLTFITYYTDLDNDNFGDLTDVGSSLCNDPGFGFATNNTDCNDGSASINPSAFENCNGLDDNCNGTADDGLTFITYYTDLDNDSFGDLTDVGSSLCNDPGFGFSTNNSDCNDSSAAINPSTFESCNGLDDNCNGTADDGLTFITYYTDLDNDSFGDLTDVGSSLCNDPGFGFSTSNTDCNDNSPLINPAAFESCNGFDDNCNGTADDGLTFITYYTDLDNDSYGDQLASGNSLCSDPGIGFSTSNSDCNDNSPLINPAALESCNGVDDNCNGTADDGLTFITYYADLDNDSFGDLADAGSSLCNDPGFGFATNNTDCNDGSASINPSALESCNGLDDNCNGTADDGLTFITYYADLDNDSYGDQLASGNSLCNDPGIGFATNNTDCNDGSAAINPSAFESCNGVDDNCNGTADDGLAFITYYADLDNDSFGDLTDVGSSLCNDPGFGFSTNNTDCNDGSAAINPSALESCNGLDDNCNGTADDGLTFITYYTDLDNDNFGDLTDVGSSLCNDPGIGFVTNNTDCNDNSPLINPAAFESCNGVDDNCNGTADDGLTFITYYTDLDNDSFGDLTDVGSSLCNDPGIGFVTNNTDCNDGSASINPSALESCNGLDDNCNGTADDGLTFITYYTDLDNDSFGDLTDVGSSFCNDPGFGFATNNTDCNDDSAMINPAATESCNNLDDNCNGSTDEGLIFITYYVDQDNDNFGSMFSAGISLCNNPGIGYSVNNSDCNDINPLINPGVIESCNGEDDNCNTDIDEGFVLIDFYEDADSDSFGNASSNITACAAPTGYVSDSTDCDDTNPDVFPGADEILPNGIDDDCDGYIDEISVGIAAIENGSPSLMIFPNPTNGHFNLLLRLPGSQETEADIELLTMSGELIFSRNASIKDGELSQEILLNNVDAAGTYHLKVTVAGKWYTALLIYQK